MTVAAPVRPSSAHPDQVALAEYEAGADLGSVARDRPDSGWAWGALGAAALRRGDAVVAYSHAYLGRALSFQAAKGAGWAEGQPITAPVLLSVIVGGLAAESLGMEEAAAQARSFLAALGHDIDDPCLLESLTR
ncbi:MAG: hypothetical protein LBK95_16330 [Bifidobacteriaceae bacterium]|jgi:hypothetical protein|nr:hypothetical protein [Bifidobacteriaceae bacterium]